MAKLVFFFFIFGHLSLLLLNLPLSSSSPLDAYSALISHGFPTGLLPENVHGYSLNSTTGDFSVHLTDTCKVILPPDNYLATYSKQITGKIVKNHIEELNGIRVRALFKWWGITSIRSNGEILSFEVGMASAKFPLKNFHQSPACEGKHFSS